MGASPSRNERKSGNSSPLESKTGSTSLRRHSIILCVKGESCCGSSSQRSSPLACWRRRGTIVPRSELNCYHSAPLRKANTSMDKAANSEPAEGNRGALTFWSGLICLLAAMAVERIFEADDGAEPVRAIPPVKTPLVEPGKRSQEHFENDQPISEQERRAKEGGRGRRANVPWHIPWNGWKDILWRVYASINDNRLLAVAAGVTFYSVLAIFPAVAAFVSLYGLVADASTIDAHLSLVAGILPGGALDILHEELTKLVAKSNTKLGLGFVFGLGVALWSANAGMKAIIDALNVVYDEKEKRSFIRLNLLSLLFTLLAILSLMVALGAVIVAPVVLSFAGLPGISDILMGWTAPAPGIDVPQRGRR
jgi:membrane protein